jgi:hypothetical protein
MRIPCSAGNKLHVKSNPREAHLNETLAQLLRRGQNDNVSWQLLTIVDEQQVPCLHVLPRHTLQLSLSNDVGAAIVHDVISHVALEVLNPLLDHRDDQHNGQWRDGRVGIRGA